MGGWRSALTRRRGTRTPMLEVSPARYTGNSAAAGTSPFSGHLAGCRWAAFPGGSVELPASPVGSLCPLHLLSPAKSQPAVSRLPLSPRCSSSFCRTPHPSSHSPRRYPPEMPSSRAQYHPHLRCGCGAWHRRRRLGLRFGLRAHAHISEETRRKFRTKN